MIVANDATVKGGTYYPITVKKHLRAQEIALEEQPALHLPGRLRRRVPALAGRGLPRPGALRAHLLQPGADVGARASRRSRWSWAPARRAAPMCRRCSDETVIVKGTGTIFLGGPPLVKAATGEEVTRRGAGRRRRPLAHHRRDRPLRRGRLARAGDHPRHRRQPAPAQALPLGRRAPEPPLRSATSSTAWSRTTSRTPYDVREVIARLVDGSRLHEFKALYGTTLVCGFARIMGYPVGHHGQQRHPLLGERAEGRRTSSSCAASGECRWSSCRTSPASWSAANTRTGASPRTGRRW